MRALFTLLLLLLLNISSAWADIETELQALDSQIKQFEDTTDNPLLDIYRETYKHLKKAKQQLELSNELRLRIEQLPNKLDLARTRSPKKPSPLPSIDRQSVPELEQLLVRYKAEQINLQKQQAELSQQIQKSDQQLLNMRQQQADLQQKLNTTPSGTDASPSTEQQKAKVQLQQALLREHQATLEVLKLKILALPGRTELATLQQKTVQHQIEQYAAWISNSENQLQKQSRAATEKTLSELETVEQELDHPRLKQAVKRNNDTSEQIRRTLTAREETLLQRKDLEQQLLLINQSYRAIQLQLELSIGYMGSEIRHHIQQLTKPLDTEETRTRLNQLRLSQLTLKQPLPELESQQPLPLLQQQQLSRIEQDYLNLAAELRTARQQQINELSLLLSLQDQINNQIESSKALFNKHLLWFPSTRPVDSNWAIDIIGGTGELIQRAPLVLREQSEHLASRRTWPLLAFFLSVIPAWFLKRYLTARQSLWSQQIGNVSLDHISHTLRPVFYGPLCVIPMPLLFYLIGLSFSPDDPHPALRNAFYVTAFLSWLYLTLIFWMQQPTGLLQGQFNLPEPLIQTLKRRIRWLFWSNTPLILALLLIDAFDSEQIRSGPGRLLLILLTLNFTLFWLSLWRNGPMLLQNRKHLRIWSNIRGWIAIITVFNLTMIGLILWGYMLSASILISLLFILVCIGILIYLLYQLGQRWLLIEERKLHFARVKARRAEIVSAREEQKEEPPQKEDLIDLKTISAQGSMLLKTAIAVIFISLLWLTLGWTLPTLEILDSVTLWSTSSVSAEGEVLDAITLKQLLFAFAALIITLIAARNLPGLFELLILNYLPLAQGTSFAISTLLKYILIITGLISFLNFLGLEWGKLQWLIAALGVGLGFGLQEIVANFVSGLIILFEKPVRIGDTVTIGGVTGTVSRIQIRATTITDWDRKEVIIPNKTFITDQLINWSLTDAVTRIIINIGVAYGTDTDKVQRLLLQVAGNNSNVLKEPPPTALFLAFGASTLDFELRAHVSSMDSRSQTIHELHTAIDQLFRKNKIEIAFPQLDVNLRGDNPPQK
ncbi:mechanosensitive ion channel domain-containing protein [Amphritea sp. HPY]|uniref:mechanosensitive ion channel domain-containing protein n=1 Tax=Amphritea sp. HPY TaxID=3421652 RepID=UPI003D7F1499